MGICEDLDRESDTTHPKTLILVVEDDPGSRAALTRTLAAQGYQIVAVGSGEEAVRIARTRSPGVILLDVCLPRLTGTETLRELRELAPGAPVIMMSTSGPSSTVIEAMRHGAFDYLPKPFDEPALLAIVERALSAGAHRPDLETPVAESDDHELLGSTPQMIELFKLVGQVAASHVTVLIQGESGTGKELVARAIHRHGSRAKQPYLPVNCSCIPEPLLESEMFGYEKGAFTSATSRHAGRFEQAHGGTLFLDEISDMPLGFQAKLLRVLQDGGFERLGGTERIFADVRLIVATRWSLEMLVKQGRFRDDLYHRLNVMLIEIPPLRERRADIPALAECFVKRHSARLRKPGLTLSSGVVDLLCERPWPGNVRELEHCIEQAIVRCAGPVILREHVNRNGTHRAETPAETTGAGTLHALVKHHLAATPGTALGMVVNAAEKMTIQEAFKAAQGNLSRTARLLGISRPTLRQKLRAFQLGREPGDEQPERPGGPCS